MSEQQPEAGIPNTTQTSSPIVEHEPTPDEAAPDEQSSGMEAADDEEEAQEAEDAKSEQVEGHPEQPEGLSQKQLEQALGKLEREAERHSKRVAEVMGSEAEVLVPCPLCEPLIPGFVMPTPDTPERFPAVRSFMGDAQQRQLKPDPDTSPCEVCGGEGMLDMLSKVEGQQALVCGYCGGKGWVGTRHQAAPSGPMAVQPLPDANGQSEVTPQGPEPPEAAKLRAMGYTLIQPVGAS